VKITRLFPQPSHNFWSKKQEVGAEVLLSILLFTILELTFLVLENKMAKNEENPSLFEKTSLFVPNKNQLISTFHEKGFAIY